MIFKVDFGSWVIRLLLFAVFSCCNSLLATGNEITPNATDSLNALVASLAKSNPEKSVALSDSILTVALETNDGGSIADAHFNLGVGYLYKDDYSSAFHHLRKAETMFTNQNRNKEAFQALNKIGLTFQRNGQLDSALAYFYEAKELQESENYTEGLADSENNIGNTYMFQGKYQLATKFLENAFSLRKSIGDPDTASSIMNLAIVEMGKGDFPKALDLYLAALDAFSTVNDSANVVQVHSNLGILYQKLYEFDEAEESFLFALEYQSRKGLLLSANKTHNNLGLLYFLQNKTELGFYHLQQSLELLERIKSKQDLWTPLLNVGYYHSELGNFEEAIEYLNRAYASSTETESLEGMCLSAIHLALTYQKMGLPKKAIPYALESVARAKRGGALRTQEYILHSTHQIYKEIGNDREALSYYQSYVAVKDSILDEHKVNQIAELSALYELKLKAAEIEHLSLENDRLELGFQLSKLKTNALWISLGAVLLIATLLVLLLRSRLKVQNANNQVLRANAANFANQITLKSELLEKLKVQIAELKDKESDQSKSQFFNIVKLLETSIKFDDDWGSFSKKLEEADPDFFKRLEKKFDTLTNNELRLAALIRLRLTNKEIASIIHVEPNSVKQSRYRLKKKLDLNQEQDLAKFLYDF